MNGQKEKTPSTGLQKNDTSQLEANVTLEPISVSLAKHLLELSKQVTKERVTPETVKAACGCASEIHKLLDLQMRAQRMRS